MEFYLCEDQFCEQVVWFYVDYDWVQEIGVFGCFCDEVVCYVGCYVVMWFVGDVFECGCFVFDFDIDDICEFDVCVFVCVVCVVEYGVMEQFVCCYVKFCEVCVNCGFECVFGVVEGEFNFVQL